MASGRAYMRFQRRLEPVHIPLEPRVSHTSFIAAKSASCHEYKLLPITDVLPITACPFQQRITFYPTWSQSLLLNVSISVRCHLTA